LPNSLLNVNGKLYGVTSVGLQNGYYPNVSFTSGTIFSYDTSIDPVIKDPYQLIYNSKDVKPITLINSDDESGLLYVIASDDLYSVLYSYKLDSNTTPTVIEKPIIQKPKKRKNKLYFIGGGVGIALVALFLILSRKKTLNCLCN